MKKHKEPFGYSPIHLDLLQSIQQPHSAALGRLLLKLESQAHSGVKLAYEKLPASDKLALFKAVLPYCLPKIKERLPSGQDHSSIHSSPIVVLGAFIRTISKRDQWHH